ncbi:MAG: hypothetical protein ACFE85_07975 [Candidatus Hodarchaeota archaeon]
MDSKDKETETEKLSQMLSIIQDLYYKKKDQIEELKTELSELQSVLKYLNSVISSKSFSSADKIYSDSLKKDYFKTEISEDDFKGTNIKRKIFSSENKQEKDLLCILNFYDFKRLEIKFIDPESRSIKETSEHFIRIFLKGALIKIKEGNPNLHVTYNFFKNSDKIEYIHISNLNSMTDYDLVTSKVRELLSHEQVSA